MSNMIVLACICVFLLLVLLFNSTRKPRNFPPGPPCVPIVGNIPLVKKLSRQFGGQYLALENLSKWYSTNVLGLKFGKENIIVVFKYETVRKVLTGEEYEGRPNSFFLKLRCMGEKRGITCSDGEVWATLRTFLVRHLRSVGFGKSPMEKMIQEELQEMKTTISEMNCMETINRLISPSVLSVLWGLVAGSRISRNDPQLIRLLDLFYRRSRAFDMSGGILSQFPYLRFIAPEFSGYNIIKDINAELKNFFMKIINEHHLTWTEGKDDDVIYSFISEIKTGEESTIFTDDNLMMVCLDVFLAGAETTGNTLDFAFLLMVLYPEVQKKVQEELDNNFQQNEEVLYSQRHRVPYVEAVLCECERFCHVVPIAGPRRVLKETILNGYIIPKDTTVLISLHSVFKDKSIWGDPDVFRPERFLDENGNLVIHEKLFPFGLGRRRCLGETLARSCIFAFFVGILKEFSVVKDKNYATPELKPLPGITLCPKKYSVQLIKRTII